MRSLELMSVVLVLELTTHWTRANDTVLLPIKPVMPISCPSISYDAVYDLRTNTITSHASVTEVSAISGNGCSTQGVLKIALASAAVDPSRRRVLIDLSFSAPTNWVFNLGDSITNNGYAGDANTQLWDAEVQGVGTTFTGYLSDMGGSVMAFTVPNLYSSRLALVVGDGHISWLSDNHNLMNYYHNSTFFALNGQPDNGPGNYDLYLALNRVIANNFRSGTGLCRVGIKFLKEF